uniref:Uncharacterized protein n=1 Tax=Graphocephala atropunctata TaxID=36148 RepID=A0A1B6LH89_9HEMI
MDRSSLACVRVRPGAIPTIFQASHVRKRRTLKRQVKTEEQEVKHEVFIKAEIEIDDGFDVSYNDPIGNFLEESETPDQDDPATASLSTPPEKKRKLCLSPPPSGSLGAGDGSLQQEIPKAETEFDLWARSVAHQLNNMELRRALQLQLKMQTLMTEDRIREDCDNMDMNPR